MLCAATMARYAATVCETAMPGPRSVQLDMAQVTVGEEGFFGPGSPDDAANPQVAGHLVADMPRWNAATLGEPMRDHLLPPCLCTQSENGATWPQQTGQDFSINYATPGIDFSAIHMWVDDWNEVRTQRLPNAAMPQGTAKPIILSAAMIDP